MEGLSDFVTLVNSIDPNLRFIIEYDIQRVHTVGMWLEKMNGKLTTTLFRKKPLI